MRVRRICNSNVALFLKDISIFKFIDSGSLRGVTKPFRLFIMFPDEFARYRLQSRLANYFALSKYLLFSQGSYHGFFLAFETKPNVIDLRPAKHKLCKTKISDTNQPNIPPLPIPYFFSPTSRLRTYWYGLSFIQGEGKGGDLISATICNFVRSKISVTVSHTWSILAGLYSGKPDRNQQKYIYNGFDEREKTDEISKKCVSPCVRKRTWFHSDSPPLLTL